MFEDNNLFTPSPLLSALLSANDPPTHLLIPDLPLLALQLLLSSLSECQPAKEKIWSLVPTLETLGAFLPSPQPCNLNPTSETAPSISYFPLRSSQPYFKDIPDLPDIQSTELFDPEYLEDVEIEEEENLSLTIVDSGQQRSGEGGTAVGKRKPRRKGVGGGGRGRRRKGSEKEEEKKKEKERGSGSGRSEDPGGQTAVIKENLPGYKR